MKTNVKKGLTGLFCTITAALMLVSCGSGDETASESDSLLNVTVSASYVSEEALSSYADGFLAAYPEWEGKVEFTAQSMGSEQTDAMMYGGQVMKQTASAAAGELDIMICDEANAARGCRGELFYPLSDVFTEEEIGGFTDILSYDLVDTEGNPTGEKTPECGVLLDNAQIDSIFGEQPAGMFIVANADLEQSKQLFLDLLAYA